MTKLRKRPRDPNQFGKLIVDIATGRVEDQAETKPRSRSKERRRPQGRPGAGPGAQFRRALADCQRRGKGALGELMRNLSTTLRHRRFLFTDSFLLLWKWRVG